jgi:hypothetical protein
MTALMFAIEKGASTEVVELLLAKGADATYSPSFEVCCLLMNFVVCSSSASLQRNCSFRDSSQRTCSMCRSLERQRW